jgi:pimeloyl-ACP methyl ester carboxylesterase
MSRASVLLGFGALLAASSGCRKSHEDASLDTVSSIATTHAADLYVEPAPPPGAVETVEVEDDRAAIVVVGEAERAGRPIVHLHGTCAVARTNVESWSAVARAYGTIVALEGDTPCPDGIGGRTWHADPASIEKRIDAAIEAVRTVRGVNLDRNDVVLLADGIGATNALALSARAPSRFSRLVLNALPDAPPPYDLSAVHAIAVLATDREPQDKARRAYEAFKDARIATKRWTLSGATQSDYGEGGARTIGEALAFVTQR